jgi:hypothetical protein
MLTGAGLSRAWPHDRAHRFFSRARWDPGELGLAAARLVVRLLARPGRRSTWPSTTPCSRGRGRRSGPPPGSTTSPQGPAKTGYGNNWVVLGVVVRLPVMSRLVMAKLVIKGSNSKSRPWLARRLAERLRRVIIAAKFTASHPNHPTPEEIHVLRLAWEDAAA